MTDVSERQSVIQGVPYLDVAMHIGGESLQIDEACEPRFMRDRVFEEATALGSLMLNRFSHRKSNHLSQLPMQLVSSEGDEEHHAQAMVIKTPAIVGSGSPQLSISRQHAWVFKATGQIYKEGLLLPNWVRAQEVSARPVWQNISTGKFDTLGDGPFVVNPSQGSIAGSLSKHVQFGEGQTDHAAATSYYAALCVLRAARIDLKDTYLLPGRTAKIKKSLNFR